MSSGKVWCALDIHIIINVKKLILGPFLIKYCLVKKGALKYVKNNCYISYLILDKIIIHLLSLPFHNASYNLQFIIIIQITTFIHGMRK